MGPVSVHSSSPIPPLSPPPTPRPSLFPLLQASPYRLPQASQQVSAKRLCEPSLGIFSLGEPAAKRQETASAAAGSFLLLAQAPPSAEPSSFFVPPPSQLTLEEHMFRAYQLKQKEGVMDALRRGANVRAQDVTHQATPLCWALELGWLDVAAYILSLIPDEEPLHAVDKRGWSELMCAVHYVHRGRMSFDHILIRTLFSRSAAEVFSQQNTQNGDTLLMFALRYQVAAQLIDWIESKTPDPGFHCVNQQGESVLTIAIGSDPSRAMRIVDKITDRAIVVRPRSDGLTPLMLALQDNQGALVDKILQRSSVEDTSLVSQDGSTALMFALAHLEENNLVDAILKKTSPAAMSAVSKEFGTALVCAVWRGEKIYTEAIFNQLLLDLEGDVKTTVLMAQDANGQTALMGFLKQSNVYFASRLLENLPAEDMNAPDGAIPSQGILTAVTKDGSTELSTALDSRLYDFSLKVLKRSSDAVVNTRDAKNNLIPLGILMQCTYWHMFEPTLRRTRCETLFLGQQPLLQQALTVGRSTCATMIFDKILLSSQEYRKRILSPNEIFCSLTLAKGYGTLAGKMLSYTPVGIINTDRQIPGTQRRLSLLHSAIYGGNPNIVLNLLPLLEFQKFTETKDGHSVRHLMQEKAAFPLLTIAAQKSWSKVVQLTEDLMIARFAELSPLPLHLPSVAHAHAKSTAYAQEWQQTLGQVLASRPQPGENIPLPLLANPLSNGGNVERMAPILDLIGAYASLGTPLQEDAQDESRRADEPSLALSALREFLTFVDKPRSTRANRQIGLVFDKLKSLVFGPKAELLDHIQDKNSELGEFLARNQGKL